MLPQWRVGRPRTTSLAPERPREQHVAREGARPSTVRINLTPGSVPYAEAMFLVPVAAERGLRAPELSSVTRPARRGAAVCARGLPPSDAPPGARHPARRSAGAHPGPPGAPWTP
jgi:hypothetical protein